LIGQSSPPCGWHHNFVRRTISFTYRASVPVAGPKPYGARCRWFRTAGQYVGASLREVKTRNGVAYKPFSCSGFEKIVQQLRKEIEGVPSYFTLDACRHGGMTELEEAALTEGQGRALSGHKTAQSYRGYAKETFDRALSATRKRHAHRLTNTRSTSIQNEGQIGVQNGAEEQKASDAN
jgi:hypothetical protein